VLSVVLITGMSCKQTPPPIEEKNNYESDSMEALGQMNRDFAKALNAKDAVAAAFAYHKGASLLPPNEPIISGRKNIQKYWQKTIDAGLIDASVRTLDAKSSGNLGYEIGTFILRFHGTKNDTIIEIGKYIEVLERNENGMWLSAYGMWSSNTPTK